MADEIPLRKDVPESDKWDLTTLYGSDEEWERALSSVSGLTEKVVSFKGKLSQGAESFWARSRRLSRCT